MFGIVLLVEVMLLCVVSSLQWVTKNVSDAQVQWGSEKGKYDRQKSVSFSSPHTVILTVPYLWHTRHNSDLCVCVCVCVCNCCRQQFCLGYDEVTCYMLYSHVCVDYNDQSASRKYCVQ